jgi:uncharacterized surface protein with fasciclin (FAS1) repeats
MKKLLVAVAALFVTIPFMARAEDKTPSIVEIAVGNKDFSTLVAAVKAAGLVDTLSGKGPFTVFAPTNAAFEKLGNEKVEAVIKDKELLTKILTAHVVSGKVMAADVLKLDGKDVTTLQGSKYTVHVKDGKVTLGDATVVKTDIVGSNGVIHVIDTVLMPNTK